MCEASCLLDGVRREGAESGGGEARTGGLRTQPGFREPVPLLEELRGSPKAEVFVSCSCIRLRC